MSKSRKPESEVAVARAGIVTAACLPQRQAVGLAAGEGHGAAPAGPGGWPKAPRRGGTGSRCRAAAGPAPFSPEGRHRVDARPSGRRLCPRRRSDRGRQDRRGPARHHGLGRRRRGDRRLQSNRHSGLCRHPQSFVRRPAAQQPSQRHHLRSDLCGRFRAPYHAGLSARRRLCRGVEHRARDDRHGHDRGGRYLADQSLARAYGRARRGVRRGWHAGGVRLFARHRAAGAVSAGPDAAAEDLFQLAGPTAHARARDQHQSRASRSRPRGRPACARSCISGSTPMRCWRSARTRADAAGRCNTSTARISTTRPGG